MLPQAEFGQARSMDFRLERHQALVSMIAGCAVLLGPEARVDEGCTIYLHLRLHSVQEAVSSACEHEVRHSVRSDVEPREISYDQMSREWKLELRVRASWQIGSYLVL